MTIDIIFIVIFLYGIIQGVRKGLFSELSTLLGTIIGIWGAINFSDIVGKELTEYINLEEIYISLVAFGLTFLGILILIFMAGRFLTKIFETMSLGIINKLLGGIFGFLKFLMIISVLMIIFDTFNSSNRLVKEEKLEKSKLYTPIKEVAFIIIPKIREVLGV